MSPYDKNFASCTAFVQSPSAMVHRSKKTARLLYASSEHSADVLYFSRFFVPDAFISFSLGRKKYGVLNMLEFARAVKEAAFDEVLPLEPLQLEAKRRFRKKTVGPVEVLRVIAKEFEIDTFRVPSDFPANIAFGLLKSKLKVVVEEDAFFPERERKTELEAKWIREGNAASAAGFRAAERVLKASTVKAGKLYFEKKVLTSERLRTIIDSACLEVGAVASHTICAGGDQACDPHCAGHGPLRANELIIIDIFPRVSKTGYHGDMTRTFLKGKPSPAQKQLVATVRDAQKRALSMIKANINGRKIHRAVLDTFSEAGYQTEKIEGVWQGFFHGTGHGLGLEVHEAPRVSVADNRLRAGTVVTIEPGLYYPGLGGCRIEDVAWVKTGGYELLSKYHYRWVL